MNACMTTGDVINDTSKLPEDTIVVMRNGEVIGLLSVEGQKNVRTLRMTFTRDDEGSQFQPLQGQCIEAFR